MGDLPAAAPSEHPPVGDGGHVWPPLPSSLAIADRQLHVVLASVPAVAASAGASALPPDELARADGFRRPGPRARYVAGRVVVRELLRRCAEAGADDAPLSCSPQGKPYLPRPGAPRFSISHADDIVLVALADEEVGVDVEADQRELDAVALARRVLGPQAATRLAALEPEARRTAFLGLWTRHEAALKCRGVGLGGNPEDAAGLTVQSLPLPGPYAGAVATTTPCKLARWSWAP